MTAPSFFYSFLLASLLGTTFHFWKGGSGGKFLMLMILSWVGFFLGHLLGSSWGIPFLMIGPISGGFGALGSIILLFLGNWVSQLDQS
ncbi:MAG: hypothetical protein MUP11_11850 [Anaerolineales bacterium]|nr:hypothetical protein [Anaerolineales bacterium]